jgi:hypothetical protein
MRKIGREPCWFVSKLAKNLPENAAFAHYISKKCGPIPAALQHE